MTLAGDVSMPLVGFGTGRLTGRRGYQAIRYALEVGYRHVDTATKYRNEREVGRALRDSGLHRDQVFLTTKLPLGSAGRELETITASMRALGTDYVDLWLVHWPPDGDACPPVWQELLAARDKGLVRAVGVSNYSIAQLDELIGATGEAPAVNQLPWSPARHDAVLLAGNRARDVVVGGYSPLRETDLADLVLAEIAATHQVTPAQIVLRWHLEHGIAVIPKSAARERVRSNFDLFGFSLSPAEVGRIDELSVPLACG